MAQTNGVTKFTFKSRNSDFAAVLVAAVMRRVTRNLPSEPLPVENWTQLKKLCLADPNYGTPAPIDMLLGADIIGNIYTNGFIAGGQSIPHAMNTHLGWIVFGAIQNINSMKYRSASTINTLDCSSDGLERAMQKLWELQEPASTDHTQLDECEKFFVSTFQRTAEGRYIVRIPFVKNPSTLGDSREIALKQFHRMEYRMSRDARFCEQYTEFIRQYIEMGHMIRVNHPPTDPSRAYYIPHHAVLAKFRVVFNASQKTTNGTSLNSIQMVGPTIQPLLLHIILRFRTYRIGFSADIEKMFRQVLIHPLDRDLQRIFWRFNQGETMAEYQLATVTYGMASAPFNAIRALQQCAHDNRSAHPIAATHVMNNFYVDDYLGGADTVEDSIRLKENLDQILGSSGFVLRKWRCSNQVVIRQFPDMKEDEVTIGSEEEDISSVLGLKWNARADTFCFRVKESKPTAKITKRIMLSEVARLYDPVGFLSPVTIIGKIFIQKIWQENCGWDDPVPTYLQRQWHGLQSELTQLNRIIIPRWIATSQTSTTEIHVFCDASSVAYAAVAYARVTSTDGIEVRLVTSKAKVAPVKTITIPRLELCAAQLGTQLLHDIEATIGLATKRVYLWSDSTIILAWLKKSPNVLKVYVANRVTSILTSTKIEQWKHIPTTLNPADCASRGLSPGELINHKLWWQGPPFLREADENWPIGVQSTFAPQEEEALLAEMRPSQLACSITLAYEVLEIQHIILLDRYSSLEKLLRITAYCMRIAHRAPAVNVAITITERQRALAYWIRHEQAKYFTVEINQCQAGKGLTKESKLYNFGAILDGAGILRIDGRLNRSPISYDARHPIILPRQSTLSRLLVAEAHLHTIHGGTQLSLNYLRQKYWILQARALVKVHRSKCVKCFRTRPITQEQRMAALPSSRVSPSPPFTRTAVDYFGPLSIKTGNVRSKTYGDAFVAVFVCLATKAIHLECVTRLTTEAFIAALTRFSSRRGHCAELWSDNATYFVGANNEWKRVRDSGRIPAALAKNHTRWHFIPPGSPHHGGLHEAGVRSVKAHLRHVFKQQMLTHEEMTTVLTRIEACLNSRPLVALHDEPTSDTMVLTPGHFLIGRPLIARPEVDLTDTALNRLSRWQLVQRIQQDFWRSWSQDYLNTLRQRYKWQEGRPNVQLGDIVVVCKENLPPMAWLLGRIIEVHPGKDGKVRVVSIKTKSGTLQRAVQKICVLPIR